MKNSKTDFSFQSTDTMVLKPGRRRFSVMQEKCTDKNESPKIATKNETSYSLHTMTLCAQLSPYEKNLIIKKLIKIGKNITRAIM